MDMDCLAEFAAWAESWQASCASPTKLNCGVFPGESANDQNWFEIYCRDFLGNSENCSLAENPTYFLK